MLINLSMLANKAPVTIGFGIIFFIENTTKADTVKHATRCYINYGRAKTDRKLSRTIYKIISLGNIPYLNVPSIVVIIVAASELAPVGSGTFAWFAMTMFGPCIKSVCGTCTWIHDKLYA